MEKIDNLDRKILEIIMKNARIPSKDVALECNVSRAAIHQRIQRMIDLDVITGSGYHVDPKVLGFATCTYIGVKLERGAMYRTVVPELEKIPEVVECHFTTGPYTMLIKLYARDNQHLMELPNDKIQNIHGLVRVNGLDQIKDNVEFANAKLLNRADGYYLAVTTYTERKPYTDRPRADVGIDMGCHTSFTLSTGEEIDVKVKEPERLKRLQRKQHRQKKGSNSRRRTIHRIQKTHQRYFV